MSTTSVDYKDALSRLTRRAAKVKWVGAALVLGCLISLGLIGNDLLSIEQLNNKPALSAIHIPEMLVEPLANGNMPEVPAQTSAVSKPVREIIETLDGPLIKGMLVLGLFFSGFALIVFGHLALVATLMGFVIAYLLLSWITDIGTPGTNGLYAPNSNRPLMVVLAKEASYENLARQAERLVPAQSSYINAQIAYFKKDEAKARAELERFHAAKKTNLDFDQQILHALDQYAQREGSFAKNAKEELAASVAAHQKTLNVSISRFVVLLIGGSITFALYIAMTRRIRRIEDMLQFVTANGGRNAASHQPPSKKSAPITSPSPRLEHQQPIHVPPSDLSQLRYSNAFHTGQTETPTHNLSGHALTAAILMSGSSRQEHSHCSPSRSSNDDNETYRSSWRSEGSSFSESSADTSCGDSGGGDSGGGGE